MYRNYLCIRSEFRIEVMSFKSRKFEKMKGNYCRKKCCSSVCENYLSIFGLIYFIK